MGEVLTYLLQKCFDPLNISYLGCHGNSEVACKIWLNSVQYSRRKCEDIHIYIYILSSIYIDIRMNRLSLRTSSDLCSNIDFTKLCSTAIYKNYCALSCPNLGTIAHSYTPQPFIRS